jgi:glycogen debranching enzyme
MGRAQAMTTAWTFSGESPTPVASGGTVTLVEESSFCLSGRGGDIHPGTVQGLFVLDTRLISCLELSIDGVAPEPLAVSTEQPFAATFVARVRRPDQLSPFESPLLVVRRRYVGSGMRDDLTVRNSNRYDVSVLMRLDVVADFADVFAVKEGRASENPSVVVGRVEGTSVVLSENTPTARTVTVRFSGAPVVDETGASWEITIPAKGEWSTCFDVSLRLGDRAVPARYTCGQPVVDSPAFHRIEAWRRSVPILDTDDTALETAVGRSLEDLGSLRLFDPDDASRVTIAAGAPWFMAVFGRDSLLTAYLSLIADPDLALGVLQTLAKFQGTSVDAMTEEEPGRILHEMRFADATTDSMAGANIYYGSIDATPLFVVLLGELRRWGLARAAVDELLPHADRALDWIENYGDRDGDGFVEYERATPNGLANQGWKDSWDGIPFADGSQPKAPIALAEVQGYVYAAYIARAYFALEVGDDATYTRFRDKAAALKQRFNDAFWMPDVGYYAMALDADKRQVDAIGSNIGHCLWTGIVDLDKAPSVARHLLAPELFSGWGVRTLATSMSTYDPMSYHCGSVWPHDNALIASGLIRYGFVDEAHRIVRGILDAGAASGGRLPELFSGISRSDVAVPVSYPASCSPQAWAAATPLQFLRLLLRLDPWIPHGQIWLDPSLPAGIDELIVSRIPLGERGMTVAVRSGDVAVSGVSDSIEVIRSGRPPVSGLLEAPLDAG